jgi:hypothetical protein
MLSRRTHAAVARHAGGVAEDVVIQGVAAKGEEK